MGGQSKGDGSPAVSAVSPAPASTSGHRRMHFIFHGGMMTVFDEIRPPFFRPTTLHPPSSSSKKKSSSVVRASSPPALWGKKRSHRYISSTEGVGRWPTGGRYIDGQEGIRAEVKILRRCRHRRPSHHTIPSVIRRRRSLAPSRILVNAVNVVDDGVVARRRHRRRGGPVKAPVPAKICNSDQLSVTPTGMFTLMPQRN